jgi:hypothetical protein
LAAIAVSADAMVRLGQLMQVVAYTPKQLQDSPIFSAGNNTMPVPADGVIKIGLATSLSPTAECRSA